MKGVYSNCFLAIIYLILRGKVKWVLGLSSENASRYKFIPHIVALNKSGHALHFEHLFTHRQNHFAPFWFFGKIRGIPRDRQVKELHKSGRKIIWMSDELWLITPILLLIWLFLAIPWILSWGLYPIFFNVKWAIHALKHNKRIRI